MRNRIVPIALVLGLFFAHADVQAAKKQRSASLGIISATLPDPDGYNKAHAEIAWIAIPSNKRGTVTRAFKGYYESTIIVYEGNDVEHRTEIMRCGNGSNQTRDMYRKLEAGHKYFFAAWHKIDDPDGRIDRSERPWWPSRAQVDSTATGYIVKSDDSRPGVKEGDMDFNDLVVTVTLE